MFLRAKTRLKDGKEHRYWSIVENRRTQGGRVVQRQVLYLGEINDGQRASWCKTIEVVQKGGARPRQMAIFPEEGPPYRSAHLRRFHGVLPSGHPETPATRTGAGLNPESGIGQVCGHADGGCSPAYHRRALPHPTSLHTTRPGSAPPPVPDETGVA